MGDAGGDKSSGAFCRPWPGSILFALLKFLVDKWEFAGPSYYAPQVRSSPCPTGILHHGVSRSSPKYRERSEPNSEPPHGGGSVVARCVSAGYPDGERLEPRRGAAESCCLVYELH